MGILLINNLRVHAKPTEFAAQLQPIVSMQASRQSAAVTPVKPKMGIQNKGVKKVVVTLEEIEKGVDINSFFDLEFIYLKKCGLQSLKLVVQFPMLRVLDLCCNDLTSIDFLQYMPFLKHLYLSCNKLTNFDSMPIMAHLESLCVSNNEIVSCAGLASVPNLVVVTLTRNKIASFASFPSIMSKIEYLDVRDNMICTMFEFRAWAISIFPSLYKINGVEVSCEERENAAPFGGKFSEYAKMGFFLHRDEKGNVFELCSSFGMRKLKEMSKNHHIELLDVYIEGEAIEGNTIKVVPVFYLNDPSIEIASLLFSKHRIEIPLSTDRAYLRIKNERVEMKKGLTTFYLDLVLPIGDHTFTIETDRESTTKTVVVEVPQVTSSQEHSVEISWLRSTSHGQYEHIGHENILEYTLKTDDCGKYLKANIRYCLSGEEMFCVFDVSQMVKPAYPSLFDLRIVGPCVEGEVVTAVYKYHGGKEGNSVIRWVGCTTILGTQYTINADDVGKSIRLEVQPLRADGQFGEIVSVESELVLLATPKIDKLEITGGYIQDNSLKVSYIYKGGIEGRTKIDWYLSQEHDQWDIAVIDSATFTPTLADVGRKIKIEVTPQSTRGQVGITKSFYSPSVIRAALPTIKSLEITGKKLEEDQTLVLAKQYHGGTEGMSVIQWLRVDNKDNRILISSATNSLSYHLQLADVDNLIEVRYIPVRSDGVPGVQMSAITQTSVTPAPPRIDFVNVIGECEEAKTLVLETRYKGGIEGLCEIRWFRALIERQEIIEARGKRQYTLTRDDVHLRVIVEVVPVRDDGEIGTPVSYTTPNTVAPAAPILSDVRIEIAGPIVAENVVLTGSATYFGGFEKFRNYKWIRVHPDESEEPISTDNSYKIMYADVSCMIKLGMQPVREDNVEGQWVYTPLTTPIIPCLPTVDSLTVVGETVEGQTLSFNAICDENTDMQESLSKWFRVDEFRDLLLSSEKEYKLTKSDIGRELKLRFTPVRLGDKGLLGTEYCATISKIRPGLPTLVTLNLNGEFTEGGTISITKQYFGGTEGESLIRWYRQNGSEPDLSLHHNNNKDSYECCIEDVGSTIKVECIPVRQDGLQGISKSVTTSIIKPAAPKLMDLKLEGEAIEECTLKIISRYYGGKEGNSVKNWFLVGDSSRQLRISNADDYKITRDDIGKQLEIQYLPVRDDGEEGLPVSFICDKIVAMSPCVTSVTIIGAGAMSEALKVQAQYKGGYEGASKIEWLKAKAPQGPFDSIYTATQTVFVPSVDDVGSFISVRYTPVRNDGASGKTETSVAAVCISIASDFQQVVRDTMTLVESGKKHSITVTDEKGGVIVLKLKKAGVQLFNAANKKMNSFKFFDFLVALHTTSATKFVLETTKKGFLVFTCLTTVERDQVVLVLRAFQGTQLDPIANEFIGNKKSKPIKKPSLDGDGSSSAQTAQQQEQDEKWSRIRHALAAVQPKKLP